MTRTCLTVLMLVSLVVSAACVKQPPRTPAGTPESVSPPPQIFGVPALFP